jgi:hypothetical protein
MQAGNVEQAIPEFERALELEPNYVAALRQLQKAEASRSNGQSR